MEWKERETGRDKQEFQDTQDLVLRGCFLMVGLMVGDGGGLFSPLSLFFVWMDRRVCIRVRLARLEGFHMLLSREHLSKGGRGKLMNVK